MKDPDSGHSAANHPEFMTRGPVQPAATRDLRRFPPTSSKCAAVRQLLRDAADGELPAKTQASVEEHMHACRPCSLALARAEHEVVQLKGAMHERARSVYGARVPMEPSAGFTAQVMSRVLAECADGGMTSADTAVLASTTLRSTMTPDQGRESGARIGLRPMWLASIATVTAAAALVIGWLWIQNDRPATSNQEVFARVVHSRSATYATDGSRETFDTPGIGSTLTGPGTWLVSPDGAVDLELGQARGPAMMSIFGPAIVHLGPGGTPGTNLDENVAREQASADAPVELVAGNLLAKTSGELSVDLGNLIDGEDGANDSDEGDQVGHAVLRLGAGTYEIDVQESRRFDHVLSAQNGGIRSVRVEVLDGEDLEILRRRQDGEVQVVTLSMGQVAHFDGGGGVMTVSTALDTQAIVAGLNPPSRPDPAGPVEEATTPWSGLAFGPDGERLTGARVVLHTAQAKNHDHSNHDGEFAITLSEQVAPFAILSAMPPHGRGDLGVMLPRPVRNHAERAGEAGGKVDDIQLLRVRPLHGKVLDEQLRPVVGASIQAVVVDELYQFVSFVGHAVVVDATGGFRLTGLPGKLAPHQSLLVVASSATAGARAMAVDGFDPLRTDASRGMSVGVDPLQAEIVLPGLERRVVEGLFPREFVDFATEIPGLSQRAALWTVSARSDAAGRAELLVPRGAGLDRWIHRNQGTHRLQSASSTAPFSLAERRPFVPTAHAPEHLANVRLTVQSRYSAVLQGADVRPEVGASMLSAWDAATGAAMGGVQMFSLARNDIVLGWLGEHDGALDLKAFLTSEDGLRVAAIGPQGALGWHEVRGGLSGRRQVLMHATGDVEVPVDLRPEQSPVLELEFTLRDGPFKGYRTLRATSEARNWKMAGLPAGSWSVRSMRSGGSVRVEQMEPVTITSGDLTPLR